MPRVERTAGSQSLVAAGTQLELPSPGMADHRKFSTQQAWQAEAWRFFDIIGEFEFAANWVGNLLSRAKLYVTKDGERVGKDDPAAQLLDQFFDGPRGQAQMLKTVGVHHTVAGECNLIGWTDSSGEDEWRVTTPSGLKSRGGKWYVDDELISGNPIRMRLWSPHPKDPRVANAPSRAALPVLSEIERLTMHVAAQVDSRLTTAGMLLIPNEAAFSASGEKKSDGSVSSNSGTRRFVESLQEVMSLAIKDRASAAANVPIVFSADGDHLKNIKHLKFWSGLDEHALALRSEAIRRLALSLDMPPEVLLGTGDSNHWASWSVEESAIKSHTEPTLIHICSSITDAYLHVALKDKKVEDWSKYAIAVDTSDLRLRPNRSKEALELYDRGSLSKAALLRETGFDDKGDKASPEEVAQLLMYRLAGGSGTPEMVAEALRALGADIKSRGEKVNEARPTPSLKDHPDQGPPDMEEAEKRAERRARQAALLSASEQVVFRALERCGNKMSNQLKLSAPKGVGASEAYMFASVPEDKVDFVLDGAIVHLDRFADDLYVDPGAWSETIEAYCRNLVSKQRHHSKAGLATALKELEFIDD